jgi:diapolycopene oxygenase
VRSKRIGVIGAGLGGLSAACTLAARGHEVVLFDKNDWTGGKAARLQEDGFRFDMGPTILIYPSVLEKIFEEAKRPVSDYLALVKLDPQWRCFFSDGSTLDLRQNPNQMAEALASFAPTSADGYRRFFALSEELHEISKRFFFWRSIGSIWDTFEFRSSLNADLLRDISRMRLGATVAGTIRKEIKDPRVAQMLDHLVQYIGSSPEKSPAILCAIGHMQSSEGVWYPVRGTRAIPDALTQLAEDLGVEVRTGVGIAKILQNGRSVTGVLTENGESVPLARLVANSDTVRAYRELLTFSRAIPTPNLTRFIVGVFQLLIPRVTSVLQPRPIHR